MWWSQWVQFWRSEIGCYSVPVWNFKTSWNLLSLSCFPWPPKYGSCLLLSPSVYISPPSDSTCHFNNIVCCFLHGHIARCLPPHSLLLCLKNSTFICFSGKIACLFHAGLDVSYCSPIWWIFVKAITCFVMIIYLYVFLPTKYDHPEKRDFLFLLCIPWKGILWLEKKWHSGLV